MCVYRCVAGVWVCSYISVEAWEQHVTIVGVYVGSFVS